MYVFYQYITTSILIINNNMLNLKHDSYLHTTT